MLGRDFAAIAARRFGGRLGTATITRKTVSGPNPADSAGPPLSTTTTYTADAIVFAYKRRKIESQHVHKADYRVVVLLGSVKDSLLAAVSFVPTAGDLISVVPPSGGAAKSGRVVDVTPITYAAATCHVLGDGP